jgi:hypothetical protein
MLDLQRVHRLLEVRRGTLNLHRVTDCERAVREADRRDADLPEEMEDLADLRPLHGTAHAWARRDKYIGGCFADICTSTPEEKS